MKPAYRKPPAVSEVEFMQQPSRWPKWPCLPVKKRTSGMPIIGVLWSFSLDPAEVIKPVIYDFNIYGNAKPDFKKIVAKYDSFAALAADGWVVD